MERMDIKEFREAINMVDRHGHPMFYQLLDRMAEIHSDKNQDYAGDDDPLRNFKACERMGIEAWRGIAIRMSDKWTRLENFVKNDTLKVEDESIEDTLIDLANYCLLYIIARRESKCEK